MTATHFPQSNIVYGPPKGLDESQVASIHAYETEVQRGNLDGVKLTITAWQPSNRELNDLLLGRPVFLSFIGGLPPHYVCTSFEDAKSIS